MDRTWISKKRLSKSYQQGVEEFINFASQKPLEDGKMACPCCNCENSAWLNKDTIRRHLFSNGFDRDYCIWICHGETAPSAVQSSESTEGNVRKTQETDDSKPSQEPEDSTSPQGSTNKGDKAIRKPQSELDDLKMIAFAYHLNKLRKNHGWTDDSFNRLINSLKSGFPLFSRLRKYSNHVRHVLGDTGTMIPNRNDDDAGCRSLTSPEENPAGGDNECSTSGRVLKPGTSSSKSSRKKKKKQSKTGA